MKTSVKIFLAKILYYLLNLFYKKKTFLVKRSSIKWELDISEGIDLSIFIFGSFQKKLTQSICSYILENNFLYKNGFSIIDIGSNIGDKSLSITSTLLKKGYKKFKILSLEPTDYAFYKQKKNINLNPTLKKKILSFKYYVSNKKSNPSEVYSSWKLNSKKKSHTIHKGYLKKINKDTKSITLDNLIKKNNIKNKIILKLDVDGGEMNVLKSCKETLKKKNILIFMEFAPYTMYEAGFDTNKFIKFLSEYNYNVFNLDFKKIDITTIPYDRSIDIVLQKN